MELSHMQGKLSGEGFFVCLFVSVLVAEGKKWDMVLFYLLSTKFILKDSSEL